MQKLKQLGSVLILTAGCSFGQIAPGAAQGQPTWANPLPLSGRGAQTGSARITQSPVPGTTTSVNTINPTVQVQGAYAGSAESATPFSGKLSLRDAIARGLRYNLGAVGIRNAISQARGESKVARSALLPYLNGDLSETVQQVNLEVYGLRFRSPVPGLSIPSVVGPFNYFDLRASLSQKIADVTAWNNYRSAKENVRANELSARDARDLVVLAVGGAYLQTITAQARVKSAQAQLDTANTLYQQTVQRHDVGFVAQIDVNRSRVQMLTQRERLVSLQNDRAKQKINLARMIGLPPNTEYELTDDLPFARAPSISLEDAREQALRQRSDLQAAEAQVRAARRAVSAARAERLPSLSLSANYGAIGATPDHSHGTFAVQGTLNLPIWEGGRVAGDIEQAQSVLAQRQAELRDLQGQIEADVQKAYLDLEAAKSQVDVTRENVQVSQENLKLTRQRFDEGVADNVEVVQSQESVAGAELDYIDSVFAHNLAKLSLARALGESAENLAQFLKLQP